MRLLEHDADTGRLKVYSSADGELLLEMEGVDIKTCHRISKAIQEAERRVAIKTKADIALQVVGFAENIKK